MKQKKNNIGSRSPHGTHSSIIQHSDIRGLPQESGAAWRERRERRERGAVRRLPRAANAKLCGPPRIRVNQMPARNNTRVIPERTACTAAMRRPLGQVSTRSRSRQHAVQTTLLAMEGGRGSQHLGAPPPPLPSVQLFHQHVTIVARSSSHSPGRSHDSRRVVAPPDGMTQGFRPGKLSSRTR